MAIDETIRFVAAEEKIDVNIPRTPALPNTIGRTYRTPKLQMKIAPIACGDGMSDRLYPDTVEIRVEGLQFEGCGAPGSFFYWGDETGKYRDEPEPQVAEYTAVGTEPFWSVNLGPRLEYSNIGTDTKFTVDRPDPTMEIAGSIYRTPTLTVIITDVRCNSSEAEEGFRQTVEIYHDGRRYEGCGGPVKP